MLKVGNDIYSKIQNITKQWGSHFRQYANKNDFRHILVQFKKNL